MNDPTLTSRQADILRYLVEFFVENGTMPSLRDIASYFKYSGANAVMCHLVALEKKGRVTRGTKGCARSFGIVGLDAKLRAAAQEFLKTIVEEDDARPLAPSRTRHRRNTRRHTNGDTADTRH